MQFFAAKPLIEKFRSGTFREEQVGPYLVAYFLLQALSAIPVFSDPSPGSTISSVCSLFVTLFGLFYLKAKNGNSFGNGFIYKYFTLGWVTGLRMIFIGLPVAIVFSLIARVAGGPDGVEGFFAVFGVVCSIVYFRWLGSLFAETLPHRSEVVAPPASALDRRPLGL